MRLVNASTQTLVSFDEAHIPPYAILSHTWGPSEITFQELIQISSCSSTERQRIENTAGYYKLSQCCRQALDDGLQYCWIDTCSIDKSSSAELSEAINSMYKWYQNAELCYAYLDDIEPLYLESNDTAEAESDILDIDRIDFGKARWFTRGWTLQELIAPKRIVFFIKGWQVLGTKKSLQKRLSRITDIPQWVLHTRDVSRPSVACRMSWASKRVTTRTEDLAYCLMGIFDINMPLLYGEGDKAFIRLQEEIMRDSDDQSLFAWFSPLAPKIIVHDIPATYQQEQSRLPGLGIGAFARHPRDFSQSGAFGPIQSTISKINIPYTLTNKGIRMEATISRLFEISEDPDCKLWVVHLACGYENAAEDFFDYGIVVQQLNVWRPDEYVRHERWGLVDLSCILKQRTTSFTDALRELEGPFGPPPTPMKTEHKTIYLAKKVAPAVVPKTKLISDMWGERLVPVSPPPSPGPWYYMDEDGEMQKTWEKKPEPPEPDPSYFDGEWL